jgi:hypothetical protein
MTHDASLDNNAPSRHLIRVLRSQPDLVSKGQGPLPESVLWRCYCELRRRGESNAEQHFIRSVWALHRRRSIGAAHISTEDPDPQEHKLVDDPLLGELWKAYKRCICAQRTGPASQLLREIEDQISAA